MMSLNTLAEAGQLVLILLFALSAAEKVRAARSGSAAWHPLVIRVDWRRRHAKLLFGASSALDLLAVALIALIPEFGGPVGIVLLFTYTILSRRHISPEGCQCFVGILEVKSFPALVARNTLLALVSTVVTTVAPLPTLKAVSAAAALAGVLWAGAVLVDHLVRVLGLRASQRLPTSATPLSYKRETYG